MPYSYLPNFPPPACPLRVLVAEDEVLNQKYLSVVITKLGHYVAIANNGNEVISLLNNDTFDIILMDITMPEMDGVEATQRIRASGMPYQNVAIVALTAHAMFGDRERFIAAGMTDYIAKPVSIEEIKSLLDKFCGR